MTAIITPPANTALSLEALVIHGIGALAYGYEGVTEVEADGAPAVRIATITYFPVYSKSKVRVVGRLSVECRKEALYNAKAIWQNVLPPDGQPPNAIPNFFGS